MRPVTLLTLLLLVCALPALAEPRATPARALLTLANDPASLRSQLLAYADSAAASDHVGAGEALGYAGTSFQREGRLDSAIVCLRRSFELLDSEETLLALADQLLLRRGAGDAAEAIRLLTTAWESTDQPPSTLVGRLAWAHFLQGKVDTAAKLFAPVEGLLLSHDEWRFRMARVALALKDFRGVVNLLLPVAVHARGTDDEVIEMLEQAGNELGVTTRLRAEVARGVDDRDRPETVLAAALGGRLLGLTASDAFPLGGLLVPAASPPRTPRARRGTPGTAAAHHASPLLAIVLLAPGDTLASGDSLALALRRHGITTFLLHPRGYGASVAPSCPSPGAWFSREAALQARIARDLRDVFRAVRRLTPVDSTRYLLVGVGASATMVVEAATLDPLVPALLLVSPAPALVDRGLTRARMARLGLPVFFQTAIEDRPETSDITEALYQAGNRPASRVVESTIWGQRLAQFRNDPTLAARFLAWLDATLRPAEPRPAAPPRPTPPARPRR